MDRARVDERSSSPAAPVPARPGVIRSFPEAVRAMVRQVPRGRVTSYGAVAAYLGAPRGARGVGWVLAALPDGTDVPWWRVVNRNGQISIKCAARGTPGLAALQRALLEGEGVVFDERGRTDLRRFGWQGPGDEDDR